MRYIRTLCATLALPPRLAPHLFTGTATLVREIADNGLPFAIEKLPALVFVTVSVAMSGSKGGETWSSEARQEEAHALVRHTTPLKVETEVFGQQVEMFKAQAEKERWKRMEWYLNMLLMLDDDTAVIGDGSARRNGDGLEGDDSDDFDDGIGKLGGGEMTMYATDWLTPKRRREYKAWEKGIKERIQHILDT
jgi:hypothetical protein